MRIYLYHPNCVQPTRKQIIKSIDIIALGDGEVMLRLTADIEYKLRNEVIRNERRHHRRLTWLKHS